jgi:V/A-type H+/Na+-transporting ATPase subunit D
MAGIQDVKPTRSELLEVKKKIRLSQSGYKLLKMKRDGLIIEFFEVLNQAKGIRAKIVQDYRRAQEAIAVASAVDGTLAVKSAAFSVSATPEVKISSKNVMGVVVPKVEGKQVSKKILERGYGVVGTRATIDEAARAYEALAEDIIKAAEIETTIKKLLDEIEKTKRRVNALEFKVIPELTEAMNFIRLRLEEMERENTFRLKRIKG